jgi:hypothetical protein
MLPTHDHSPTLVPARHHLSHLRCLALALTARAAMGTWNTTTDDQTPKVTPSSTPRGKEVHHHLRHWGGRHQARHRGSTVGSQVSSTAFHPMAKWWSVSPKIVDPILTCSSSTLGAGLRSSVAVGHRWGLVLMRSRTAAYWRSRMTGGCRPPR